MSPNPVGCLEMQGEAAGLLTERRETTEDIRLTDGESEETRITGLDAAGDEERATKAI